MAQGTAKDSERIPHACLISAPSAKAALEAALPLLEGIEPWTEAELHDRVMEAIPGLGMKNGQFLWPLRIAISGQMSTPGGAFEIAYLLGRDETLRRLKAAIEKL